MKIKKGKIDKADLIAKCLPADYVDSFECVFSTDKEVSTDDVMVAFWTNSPKWVDRLFKLRDCLVKPFGIKPGNGGNKELFEKAIREGGSYRFFETVSKNDTETVIMANDKHLKMYFSIKTVKIGKEQQLCASTVVKFHNWLGRIYFFIIYPFHQLIVPQMIKHSLKGVLD